MATGSATRAGAVCIAGGGSRAAAALRPRRTVAAPTGVAEAAGRFAWSAASDAKIRAVADLAFHNSRRT